MASTRSVAIFCMAQLFLLCLVGTSLQLLFAIHRIDDSNPNNPVTDSHGKNNYIISTTKAKPVRPVIAYAVTLTGCGDNKRYTESAATSLITQGAAVLRHSIHLAHNAPSSKYDYRMYALVHPSAKECSAPMSKLGYTTLLRNTPFDKADIRKEFLREHVDGASCCGAKEYIKLYAYTLTQHPIAVILDLDSLVLRPLDDLFDAMLLLPSEEDGTNDANGHGNKNAAMLSKVPVHGQKNPNNAATIPIPRKKMIDAFYTRDYNMVNPGGEKYAGVQGGFLMLRPNEATFDEYIDIVLEGDYREGRGWGGKYGYFFGGMQIQGICAYYYGERHPEAAVELDRCRVNAMVDNPYFSLTEKKKPGECRDGGDACEDCRSTDVSEVLSAHFTLCGKPWECRSSWDSKSRKLCMQLHSEWFRIRRSFEESRMDADGGDSADAGLRQLPDLEGAYMPENYFGYCNKQGERGYLPVKI